MEKSDLKVILGGAETQKRDFISGYITDTRLMGVLVMYLHFTPDLHQYFYIEISDYGLETYRSVEGDASITMLEIEHLMLGGLGGIKIDITERQAKILLQRYAKITKENGYDLPKSYHEYKFLIEDEIKPSRDELRALFFKTTVPLTNNEQLINYFLMRYFARDFEAITYLSDTKIDTSHMPNIPRELCLNKIEPIGETYMCEAMIESPGAYEILTVEIKVEGRSITHFDVKSHFGISQIEAAMKLGRPEYINVFEILSDLDSVKRQINRMYPAAMQNKHDYGTLFLNFKSDNDHVSERVFRLNDDIRALFYITDFGQLVVVSYHEGLLELVEGELENSDLEHQMFLSGRYEFHDSVFYEFLQGDFVDFAEFISYLND